MQPNSHCTLTLAQPSTHRTLTKGKNLIAIKAIIDNQWESLAIRAIKIFAFSPLFD
jgi:hypothetical protein